MRISLIIPVLNEARRLPALIAELEPLRASGVEVIVVDGGSDDASVALAAQAGVRVVSAAAGRARQMNAGVNAASGDILLFLHADTSLPPGAEHAVIAALAGDRVWGRFDVRIEGRSAMLCVIGFMMNLRSRATGIATGDQAIFVARKAFDAAGGFPEQPLMEDIELSRRLKTLSRPACLRGPVMTSGRRWERDGVWRTILLMWQLRWWYWRGVPAAVLAERYR